MQALVAVLSWEPQLRGALVVFLAVVLLPGSVYMLLSTNTGARLGFLIAATGLMGWMTVMAVVWTVYGIGLKGPTPVWKPTEVVTGNLAKGGQPQLATFPATWKKQNLEDPKTTEAISAADAELAPPAASGKKGPFAKSSDYLPIAAYDTGGQDFGPLGLNFRPFNVFHKPHFLVLQVQAKAPQTVVPGTPPPPSRPDPSAPVVSVVMVRDLGALRQPSALVALSSFVLFVILASTLHRRDKRAIHARAQPAAT